MSFDPIKDYLSYGKWFNRMYALSSKWSTPSCLPRSILLSLSAQSVCLPFLLAGIVHILHLNYSTANPDHRSSDQTNGSDLKGLAFRRTLPREMRLDRFQIHHFSASITVILQNDWFVLFFFLFHRLKGLLPVSHCRWECHECDNLFLFGLQWLIVPHLRF